MQIIGIDPGATGAMAVLDFWPTVITETKLKLTIFPFESKEELRFMNMKPIKAHIEKYKSILTHIYIEDVHAMPHDGKRQVLSFGKAIGYAHCLFEYNELYWNLVSPQKWQMWCKVTGPYAEGKRKAAHLARAKQLFPEAKGLTQKTADAALIAYYGYLLQRSEEIKNI